jgi:transcriptional regulator GlxA family with amidase domain
MEAIMKIDRRMFIGSLAAMNLPLSLPAIQNARPAGITPPERGGIQVAFVLGPNATMIDFTGPWEVFQDVHVHTRGSTMEEMMPFRLYTVSDTKQPLRATGGMTIIPDHDFKSAPKPHVIVIPAQGEHSAAKIDWIREMSRTADVTMSVCTGAFLLAKTGLLDGKLAATHHDFCGQFESAFPKVKLQRGLRFVENGGLCSAGGLTSGIDLALRVVERYFGRGVAEQTAVYMEYQSKGWVKEG